VSKVQHSGIQRIEMSDAEIEGLLQKAGSEALSAEEVEKLRELVETLRYLTSELAKKHVSLQRLKRMLFGEQSEKTGDLRLRQLLRHGVVAAQKLGEQQKLQEEAAQESKEENKPKQPVEGHGRRGADEYGGAEHIHVPHQELKHKDRCPKCGKGKLYLQKQPKVMVRLTGSAPVVAKVWTYDWLRCNACGAIFDAKLPEEAGPPEKYDASVTATIGLMRYGMGMPLYRLAKLQGDVHIPLPAGTQWNLLNATALWMEAVFVELMREAACGELFHNDDTVGRILELMKSQKDKPPPQGNDGGDKERKGIYTTGVISQVGERKIALFLTGRNHAGENLEEVLSHCEQDERHVIQMSDGLSRNAPRELPEGLSVIEANCLAHGRRKYVEIADNFPAQCLHVLEEIEKVYKNDQRARQEKLSQEERLIFHQRHSKPVMDELEGWLKEQVQEKLVEPNGGFGKATEYMLKRWERLTRFLVIAGAPLDNNICERALKQAIRHRKNSLFYKTLHGARVGDMYMSLIHTCELNGINPLEYLTALIAQGERVAEEPKAWLPWTYASGVTKGVAAQSAGAN
jgi:transposase